VVNNIVFALNEAIAESVVLAERAGVDPEQAYEVLANSAIAAPLVGYKREAYLRPDETPTAFALELAGKDLQLVLALASEVGAQMPQTVLNLDRIEQAATRYAGRDFSFVAEHLRDLADPTRTADGEGSR
jgi:3-hydroxyisobutyrate dehydrogenase-like beta-hydroxyacid dehydrogenase